MLAPLTFACGQTVPGADASSDRVVNVDSAVDALADVTPPPHDASDVVPPPTDEGPPDVRPDAQGSDVIDVVTADASQPDAVSLDARQDVVGLDALADVTGIDASLPDAPAVDAAPFDVPYAESYVVDGATACNATVNDAPLITFTTGVGAAPAPIGGVVVPGHYQLTSIVSYGAPAPTTLSIRESVDLTSTHIFAIGEPMGMPAQRATLSYTSRGTLLDQVTLCPAPSGPTSSPYSATATQFILFSTTGTATIVGTFDRR